jgi:hypothetical protein
MHEPIGLDNLIGIEKECNSFISRTIEELLKFYSAPFFHVSYSDQSIRIELGKEKPNAATSVVIRLIQNFRTQATELTNKVEWEALQGLSNKSMSALADNANFHDVLPLHTMGVLPLFTSCYLAEIFSCESEFETGARKQLEVKAYALVMRKVFFSILNDAAKGFAKNNMLHPFLLYRCTKAVNKIKALLKYSCENGLSSEIETFWRNLSDRAALEKAMQQRGVTNTTAEEIEFMNEKVWEDFNNKFSKVMAADPTPVDNPSFRYIIDFLENRAIEEALKQIARQCGQTGPEMDAAALVFSLGVLSEIDNQGNAHIIAQGLQTVLDACETGQWHAVMPFQFDDKGRAIFVPSIEVAYICLTVYLRQIREKSIAPDINFVLSSTAQIQQRLVEHINIIEIFEDEQKKRAIGLQGWCTDKAPSYTRIDSWVTAHALAFFLNRLSLTRLAKKNLILKHYSFVPFHHCGPKWEDIVDPDMGLAKEGESVKDIIEGTLNEDIYKREKSPMFLLYGPPGTAKTTLVQGIANKKQWDLIQLSPSDFIKDGVDKIEEYSREIFKHLTNLDKCIILMDEMDSLFRDRATLRLQNSPLEFVIPAFLPKLQRLRDYIMERQMAVFINTNYYETVDSAIARGGRIDYRLLVLPYSYQAKEQLITKFLDGAWVENDSLTGEGKAAIKKVLNQCPPILVYREIEQLGKQLARKWPDPKKAKPSEIEIAYSVNPEIYRPGIRKEAFQEVCALVDRIKNNKRQNYELWTKQHAFDYLKKLTPLSNVDEKYRDMWKTFVDSWISTLKTEA